MKKIYLLKPVTPWSSWYDKAFGFVVIATSSKEARQLASEQAGAEDSDVWLNRNKTTCKILKPTGEPRIILRDFAAA